MCYQLSTDITDIIEQLRAGSWPAGGPACWPLLKAGPNTDQQHCDLHLHCEQRSTCQSGDFTHTQTKHTYFHTNEARTDRHTKTFLLILNTHKNTPCPVSFSRLQRDVSSISSLVLRLRTLPYLTCPHHSTWASNRTMTKRYLLATLTSCWHSYDFWSH